MAAAHEHELDTAVAYMEESVEAGCHPYGLRWLLWGAFALIQDVPEGEASRLQVGIRQGLIGEVELVGISEEELPITSPTIGQSDHDTTAGYRHAALARVLQSHISTVVDHPTLRN